MSAKKPLPRKHIASLGGYARARSLGAAGMSNHSKRVQDNLREQLGESAYRERFKRMRLRGMGHDVEVVP